MICFSASVQLIKTCSHPFLKHSLKVLQLSGWWVVFTVQLASFLATCWLLLQWTYNKWYPHTYFFNPVQLIFFSNKFYCAGTTLKKKKYIKKLIYNSFRQPLATLEIPLEIAIPGCLGVSRGCMCACVCCASSTILPQLWPSPSVGMGAPCLCMCVCVSSTVQHSDWGSQSRLPGC